MAYRRKKSRLSKIEEKRSIRQAVLFGGLTLILIAFLLFFGIPGLIKLAVFFGNIRSTNQPIETQEDLPPPPPHFKAVPEATNSSKISLAGYGQAGSTVKISLDNIEKKEVIVNTQGEFSVVNFSLKKGENKITAIAYDKSGKKSRPSEEITIVFDNQPPTLQIISPKDKDEFFDKDKEIKVEGETDTEASVDVNGRFVIVGANGNFQTTLELKEGENEIRVTTRDIAGNQTEKKLKVKYTP